MYASVTAAASSRQPAPDEQAVELSSCCVRKEQLKGSLQAHQSTDCGLVLHKAGILTELLS
jgi:hypothetical protein